jgi:hypothetical protein
LASAGAQWLSSQILRIGRPDGLLGWLTDHFTVTYHVEDLFPIVRRDA